MSIQSEVSVNSYILVNEIRKLILRNPYNFEFELDKLIKTYGDKTLKKDVVQWQEHDTVGEHYILFVKDPKLCIRVPHLYSKSVCHPCPYGNHCRQDCDNCDGTSDFNTWADAEYPAFVMKVQKWLKTKPIVKLIAAQQAKNKLKAQIDLVGIEPNPGPKCHKCLSDNKNIYVFDVKTNLFICDDCEQRGLSINTDIKSFELIDIEECHKAIPNSPCSSCSSECENYNHIKTSYELYRESNPNQINFYPLGLKPSNIVPKQNKAGIDLIGIEPNPGPNINKKIKKVIKKDVKRIVKGRGNYKMPKTTVALGSRAQSGFTSAKPKSEYIRKATLGEGLASVANSLGDWLSDKATKWFGQGDYAGVDLHLDDSKITSNSLLAGTSVPEIKNKGQAFIFRHREYVGDVAPTTNFSLSSFILNPGNQKLFPWLYSLAAAFEEYQIIGMIAEYKPLVSAVSANSIGAVVFATEYNVAKPNFSSKVAMENYEYATSCAPHHAMLHAIECAPDQTLSPHRNVLVGSVPSGYDPRLYHWGNLQLATQGQANTTGVIGEFWLTYEIACFKPLFASSTGAILLSDSFYSCKTITASNSFSGAGGALVTGITARKGNCLGTTITLQTPETVITFPVSITTGLFLISYFILPSANWSAGGSITSTVTTANCSLVTGFFVNNGTLVNTVPFDSYAVGGAGQVNTNFLVSVNAPGATVASITITIAGTAAVTNTISSNITISPVCPQMDYSVLS